MNSTHKFESKKILFEDKTYNTLKIVREILHNTESRLQVDSSQEILSDFLSLKLSLPSKETFPPYIGFLTEFKKFKIRGLEIKFWHPHSKSHVILEKGRQGISFCLQSYIAFEKGATF